MRLKCPDSIGKMTRRALLALLSALWALPSPAAGPALPEFEVLDRLNPVDPLPERETRWDYPGVTLTAVTYSTVPGYRPLRLDLYRPAGATTPQPLVVFVHGGGWSVGNPRAGAAFRDFAAVLAGLAARGYVVASIEYRLNREAAHPAPSEDLAAALEFLRANASRFGIDARRIALWGMSAGAHVAASNAMACEPARCVQGLVGWFGTYDLASYGAATAAAAAPAVLLLHGIEDTNVPARESAEFAQRLREAGAAPELMLLPGVAHGFIGADADATRRALQQALTATFEFLDRVLAPNARP
jgi:acetyl esterase/lipase